VGVSKPSQNIAFAFESFFGGASRECDTDKLDRSLPLEPAVTAFGQPDAAHSALSNLRNQRVGANRLAREPHGRGQRRFFQESFLRQALLLVQYPLQKGGQVGIFLA